MLQISQTRHQKKILPLLWAIQWGVAPEQHRADMAPALYRHFSLMGDKIVSNPAETSLCKGLVPPFLGFSLEVLLQVGSPAEGVDLGVYAPLFSGARLFIYLFKFSASGHWRDGHNHRRDCHNHENFKGSLECFPSCADNGEMSQSESSGQKLQQSTCQFPKFYKNEPFKFFSALRVWTIIFTFLEATH